MAKFKVGDKVKNFNSIKSIRNGRWAIVVPAFSTGIVVEDSSVPFCIWFDIPDMTWQKWAEIENLLISADIIWRKFS